MPGDHNVDSRVEGNDQFKYPWGAEWGNVARPKTRAPYKRRRFPAHITRRLNCAIAGRLMLQGRPSKGLSSEQARLF